MIRDDLTNEQYHALKSISKSGLDRIAQSPAHFQSGFQGIGADTARIGTAAHAMLLEGGKGLLTGIDCKRSSAANKAEWNEWFQAHGAIDDIAGKMPAAEWFPEFERVTGNVIITPAELKELERMKDSVMANNLAEELLSTGKPEQSILFKHNGIDCRIRPDWMIDNGPTVDIKSTVSAARSEFGRSVSKYRYHVQDAMYSQGRFTETNSWQPFFFIAVEKKAPYSCAVYQLDEAAKAEGYRLFERDLDVYQQCVDSGVWPSYDNDLNLSIPIWDKPEIVENYEELMA